ncbi:MAG TPA: RodZ domain-containing protein [Steroidobacteraceae bacterium]|jgi:cytoskeleton protein RodZ|nr:RodZ domain-containing protein [Steroidobacteraceae bacterium]
MTDLAASPGPRLKAERERRGLSSQKVADELHLDGWVVDALEAGDYERIGPSVYAKGHLKRYAAMLGLPQAEIMAAYETRAQAPKEPSAQPANVRLRADSADVSNLPLPQIIGSIAVVLLVLGVLWWKPWHQRGAAPTTREPVAATPTAVPAETAAGSTAETLASAAAPPAPTPAPAGAAATSSQSAPLLPGAAAATPAQTAETNATAGVGRARLRLSFSADSWVDVHDAAGHRAFAGNGRANSVRTIAGIAPMRVYLRSASGVQLEINNRAVAIGPQFFAGDAARFEAGADGVLRRDSHSVAAPGAPTTGAATSPPRNARPTG